MVVTCSPLFFNIYLIIYLQVFAPDYQLNSPEGFSRFRIYNVQSEISTVTSNTSCNSSQDKVSKYQDGKTGVQSSCVEKKSSVTCNGPRFIWKSKKLKPKNGAENYSPSTSSETHFCCNCKGEQSVPKSDEMINEYLHENENLGYNFEDCKLLEDFGLFDAIKRSLELISC